MSQINHQELYQGGEPPRFSVRGKISNGTRVSLFLLMLPQDTAHLIRRPCYQRGSPCQDPAGSRTTRRPDHRKDTQTKVVRTCLPSIIIIIIIITIYPLTARVFEAPQIISQPVSSIFPCSPLPCAVSYTHLTLPTKLSV